MDYIDKINKLINDMSFPPMVLLDGAWGSGKTHFIRNSLMPNFESKFEGYSVKYFSLYGVSGIEDFKDRIISSKLSDTAETKKLEQIATTFTDAVGKFFGQKGLGGAISGAAGALKYHLYTSLDKQILILDDLERISNESVIKDILGECFNLVETKDIKVIVVANDKQLKCRDDIEKVFADTIKFTNTPEQVVEIIKQEFANSLDEELLTKLSSVVLDIGLTNLRVLKRAIGKFIHLKNEILEIPDVDYDLAFSSLLKDIIKTCFIKYEKGFTNDEILSAKANYLNRLIGNNDNTKLSDRDKELRRYSDCFLANELIIRYCIDTSFKFTNLEEELKLPFNKTVMQKFLHSENRLTLTEEEFQNGKNELIDFINQKSSVNFNDWFRAIDAYLVLAENKFIQQEISKNTLLNLCKTRSLDTFDSDKLVSKRELFYFSNQEINEIYDERAKELNSVVYKAQNENLKTRFVNSWQSAKAEITDRRGNKPFLYKIGKDLLIESFTQWEAIDLKEFDEFLINLYNFSNIDDYFIDDHQVMKDTASALKSLELTPSIKTAYLYKLTNTLCEIVGRMDERLEAKAVSVTIQS